MGGIGRIISVGIILLCAACAHRPDAAGTWKGKREVAAIEGADPVVVANLNRVVLTLHRSGKFDLFDRGFPRRGAWWFEGKEVHLRIEQAFDRRLEKTDESENLTLVLKSDRDAELRSSAGTVLLHRESQPVRSMTRTR